MPERIGPDLNLLCQAVQHCAGRALNAETFRRNMMVGFARAGRLLVLLEDYGLAERDHASGRYRFLVTDEQVNSVVSQLRDIAAREDGQLPEKEKAGD